MTMSRPVLLPHLGPGCRHLGEGEALQRRDEAQVRALRHDGRLLLPPGLSGVPGPLGESQSEETEDVPPRHGGVLGGGGDGGLLDTSGGQSGVELNLVQSESETILC